MKKSFKLDQLGCANCASKMENSIAKIPGVKSVTIAFMTAKLKIEADAEDFDRILDEAQRIISGYERECRIVR